LSDNPLPQPAAAAAVPAGAEDVTDISVESGVDAPKMTVKDKIEDGAADMMDKTADIASDVKDGTAGMVDKAADMADDVKDSAEGMVDKAAEVAGDMKDDVKEGVSKVVEDVKDAVTPTQIDEGDDMIPDDTMVDKAMDKVEEKVEEKAMEAVTGDE